MSRKKVLLPSEQQKIKCSYCGHKHQSDELCGNCNWNEADNYLLSENPYYQYGHDEDSSDELSPEAQVNFNRMNQANY